MILFLIINSQINDKGIDVGGDYTNNISERQFRTLKATISRQLVNFGMAQLIVVLTIQTQTFYENKNLNRVHSTTYITISTNLSSSSSSSSSVSEIMDCKYDEEDQVFIVDGHRVLPLDLICSCESEEEDDDCEHIRYLLDMFEILIHLLIVS